MLADQLTDSTQKELHRIDHVRTLGVVTVAYRASPRAPEAQLLQAKGLQALDRPEKALEAYRKVIDGWPDTAWATQARLAIATLAPDAGK